MAFTKLEFINYILNGRADKGAALWKTYQDAASALPVDGIGGTPTVTFGVSQTTPLSGASDFNFTKPAANVQGQGVSIPFDIESSDLAKVLSITFDYEVVSGTYADGDLSVYVVQDPSGTPVAIQPAGFRVLNLASGNRGKVIATFQTHASIKSYRLCLHVASTSTAAYVLAVDNVSVGPQVVQYGAPMTDKQTYSIQVTAVNNSPTFGTQVVNQATWRRVGDCMEIQFQYRQSSAGSAGNGIYLFSLPSGYAIDTAKLNLTGSTTPFLASTIVGTGSIAGSGNQFTGYVAAYDSTKLYISAGNDAINPGPFSNATSQNFGTGPNFYLSFIAMVPILGWSSTVQMSNDTDTRVVAAKAYASAAQAISGSTTLAFGTVVGDTHGGFTSSTTYTVQVPGWYRATANLTFGGAATSAINLNINKNGTAFAFGASPNTALTFGYAQANGKTLCNAGDTITVTASQNSAAANYLPGLALTYLDIERISGPSAIAASETVAFSAYQDSGQTIPTASATTVIFNQVDDDSHGSYNKSTGIWKAPAPGKYMCVSNLGFTTAVSDTNSWEIGIQKNGVNFASQLNNKQTTGFAARMNLHASREIRLAAGDEIKVIAYQDTGSGRGLATGPVTNFSIFRIGV